MLVNQIKIESIDNGYLVTYVKFSALNQQPKQVAIFLATFKEVVDFLGKEFQ